MLCNHPPWRKYKDLPSNEAVKQAGRSSSDLRLPARRRLTRRVLSEGDRGVDKRVEVEEEGDKGLGNTDPAPETLGLVGVLGVKGRLLMSCSRLVG